MIETENLTKKFNGFTAVDHVSFEVEKGDIFGYLGLNGAGKTTTVNMLTTILPPTEGTARIDENDIVKNPLGVREVIGVVFESELTPKPSWTAYQYLLYFGTLQGLDDAEIEERAKSLLKSFKLLEFANKELGTFSEGMKKKVEICRAMLSYPKILFLDEPTKDLDIPMKREVWETLRSIAIEDRVTIFLCSHDIYEINELCNKICVIAKGKITFSGNIEDIRLGKDVTELEKSVIKLLGGE
jgi:ABC-type multidrug transport system ATPase subunit